MVRVLKQMLLAGAACGIVGVVPAPTVLAAGTPPSSVTIAGSLQSELGCPGDWQPECTVTQLTYNTDDDVWRQTFDLPAGSYEYKAALNNSWDENYGAGATLNGPNIGLTPAQATSITFYYDQVTHWVTDNVTSRIATAAGNFQSELGCPGDWDPGCLRSWLQDVDGDGIYRFTTTDLPPGDYEWKVAVNEAWDENYGAGGVPGGVNIGFTVGSGDQVTFSWDSGTNIPTVTVGSPDGDDDGVADDVDNCPATPNADQANFDGDALGDACDPDDDNDGVADGDDAFPLDPSESSDVDGDGLGDNADPDDDNDGQSDTDEAACGSDPTNAASTSPDSDGDHVPDCVDLDDDNDGVADDVDRCPATDLAGDTAPGQLKKNRMWSNDSGEFLFGDGSPAGVTIADTLGCSASQVIDDIGLGNGHEQFGISKSAMKAYLSSIR